MKLENEIQNHFDICLLTSIPTNNKSLLKHYKIFLGVLFYKAAIFWWLLILKASENKYQVSQFEKDIQTTSKNADSLSSRQTLKITKTL